MKSRRPPLNLSEPRTRAPVRSEPDGSEAGGGAREAADLGMTDVLEAPFDSIQTAESDEAEVVAAAVSQPSRPVDIDIPGLDHYDMSGSLADADPQAESLDIPEPASKLTPPPEVTPPVRAAEDKPEVAPAPPRRDIRPLSVEAEGVMKATGSSGLVFWGAATLLSLVCACGIAAFILGAQGGISAFDLQPFRIGVLSLLALLPVGLIFASAFALRNAAALARQAQRASALADAMVSPAVVAASQTTDMVDALRAQVDHAVRAVRLAHADVTELSSLLRAETERLQEAAALARNATQSVSRAMEYERNQIGQMSAALSVQTGGIIEAVDRQARMVADASDLAQTQLREAEATLAARATDMIGQAHEITDSARAINDDLERQIQRLETAGSGVSDQLRSVEDGLSQQRAGLVSTALSLRADQEDFAVHIENQRAQLTEALSITRVATVDLGETSARGIDVLRDIVLTAKEHFHEVMGAAENERTAFETRIHQTLSNISVMAADARDDLVDETRRSLEQLTLAAAEAKKAADMAAQTAQARVDRLNESIFEASKKADEVFDARFSAARRLIEDSAELIHEAGDQTVEKLDLSFARTSQAITDVSQALNELSQSADQLPLMAQDRLHDIRKSVEDGLLAMTTAARKAAMETEAIDAAFQDRVRRNYDMLTEAVRLMGVISGDQGGGQRAIPPMPRPTPVRPAPQAQVTQQPPVQPQPQPAPQPTTGARLRLSPMVAETRPSPGPQPVSATRGKGGEGWSWRELLSGMDGGEIPADGDGSIRTYEPAAGQTAHQAGLAPMPPHDPEFDSLDSLMVSEVTAMGVDAVALLSRARVDEIIAAVIAEDNEGARDLVRRIAPAAIRRMSRRLASDAGLHRQANDFAGAYDQQINDALMSNDPARGLSDLLLNDVGRAYLLLDAAMGELI